MVRIGAADSDPFDDARLTIGNTSAGSTQRLSEFTNPDPGGRLVAIDAKGVKRFVARDFDA